MFNTLCPMKIKYTVILIIISSLYIFPVNVSAVENTLPLGESTDKSSTASYELFKPLSFRLEAVLLRLGKINDREVSRFEKIRNINKKAAKLNKQFENLKYEMKSVQDEYKKTVEATGEMSLKQGNDQYGIFKNTITNFKQRLMNLLFSQTKFASDMKLYELNPVVSKVIIKP
jgi:hypothetical protein